MVIDLKITILYSVQINNSFEIVKLEKGAHDDRPIFKPGPIVGYNETMGGEDLADQTLEYYAMERKSIKWYKKIFFHLTTI